MLNEEQRKTLIHDMAFKVIEDTMHVLKRNHELVHIGGGNCQDAAISKVVALQAMSKIATTNLPADIKEYSDPIIADIVSEIEKQNAEELSDLERRMAEAEPELDNLIRGLVSKLFGVEETEITVEEINIGPNGKQPEPTKH